MSSVTVVKQKEMISHGRKIRTKGKPPAGPMRGRPTLRRDTGQTARDYYDGVTQSETTSTLFFAVQMWPVVTTTVMGWSSKGKLPIRQSRRTRTVETAANYNLLPKTRCFIGSFSWLICSFGSQSRSRNDVKRGELFLWCVRRKHSQRI